MTSYWNKKKIKRAQPLAFRFNKQYALIDNEFKLYGISNQSSQLYHLGQDAGEKNDLSSTQPKKLETLERLYRDWNLSIQNSNAGGDY